MDSRLSLDSGYELESDMESRKKQTNVRVDADWKGGKGKKYYYPFEVRYEKRNRVKVRVAGKMEFFQEKSILYVEEQLRSAYKDKARGDVEVFVKDPIYR